MFAPLPNLHYFFSRLRFLLQFFSPTLKQRLMLVPCVAVQFDTDAFLQEGARLFRIDFNFPCISELEVSMTGSLAFGSRPYGSINSSPAPKINRAAIMPHGHSPNTECIINSFFQRIQCFVRFSSAAGKAVSALWVNMSTSSSSSRVLNMDAKSLNVGSVRQFLFRFRSWQAIRNDRTRTWKDKNPGRPRFWSEMVFDIKLHGTCWSTNYHTLSQRRPSMKQLEIQCHVYSLRPLGIFHGVFCDPSPHMYASFSRQYLVVCHRDNFWLHDPFCQENRHRLTRPIIHIGPETSVVVLLQIV